MYKTVYKPEHPRADITGLVGEHVLVAESFLGRSLTAEEIVHHKDFNKLNNKPGNLAIITRKEHQQLPEFQARFLIAHNMMEDFWCWWNEHKNDPEDPVRELEKKLVAAETRLGRAQRLEEKRKVRDDG